MVRGTGRLVQLPFMKPAILRSKYSAKVVLKATETQNECGVKAATYGVLWLVVKAKLVLWLAVGGFVVPEPDTDCLQCALRTET